MESLMFGFILVTFLLLLAGVHTLYGRGRLGLAALLWVAVFVSAIALASSGCNLNLNRTDVFNGQGQVTGPTAASPAPQSGACEAAARVEARVVGGGEVAAGSIERLDATAYTASGREIAGACALAKTVSWAAWSGPCEFVSSPSGFNPEFRGNAPGSCSTTVTIDAASAPLSVRVR